MPPQDTTFDDHSWLAYRIFQVLQDFIGVIRQRRCPTHLTNVLKHGEELDGAALTQEPERFTEDHLIFPILEQAFQHSYRPRPKRYAPKWPRSGTPDFCLTSLPINTAKKRKVRLFGEAKPPNHIEDARHDITSYLKRDLDFDAIAIATDGIDWELWIRHQNESLDENAEPFAEASLRGPIQTVRWEYIESKEYSAREVRKAIDIDGFSAFTKKEVMELMESEFGKEPL